MNKIFSFPLERLVSTLRQAAVLPDIVEPNSTVPTYKEVVEKVDEETCPICNKIRGGSGKNKCACRKGSKPLRPMPEVGNAAKIIQRHNVLVETKGETVDQVLRVYGFEEDADGWWSGKIEGVTVKVWCCDAAVTLYRDTIHTSAHLPFFERVGSYEGGGEATTTLNPKALHQFLSEIARDIRTSRARKAANLNPEQLSVELKREFFALTDDLLRRSCTGQGQQILQTLANDLINLFGYEYSNYDRSSAVERLKIKYQWTDRWNDDLGGMLDWTAHALGKRQRNGI